MPAGVRGGLLQVVHDRALVVRLEEVQFDAERFRPLAKARLDVGKRLAPVLGGIAHSEPIQIRAVDDNDFHDTHARLSGTNIVMRITRRLQRIRVLIQSSRKWVWRKAALGENRSSRIYWY